MIRPDFLPLVAFGLGIAIVSWGTTGLFRRWALRNKVLDIPNERSSHTKPTPRGGGIGIIIAVLAGGAAMAAGFPDIGFLDSGYYSRIGFVAFGAFLIVSISWLDDVRHGLSPVVRLGVHSAAAGLALIGLGGWTRILLPFAGTIDLGWIGIPAALFWIVGLVNVYNFMDGIDGIAGVQAVAAASGWAVVGLLSGCGLLFAAGLLIGAAAVGFLIHNWPPARIFMGDIGSSFLGFAYAVIPFLTKGFFRPEISERLPVAGFLMVSPFVLDATFTLLRRILKREKLSQAHRSHLYQRLTQSGLGHQAVTLLYFVLSLMGSAAAVGYMINPHRFFGDILTTAAAFAILAIPLTLVLIRENRRPRRKEL